MSCASGEMHAVHKQKAPARDSKFVSLRIAAEETGLPYSLLYGAFKRGEIQSLTALGNTKRPVVYLLRASLNTWLDQRLTKREAA
jgi:hypothetical protein